MNYLPASHRLTFALDTDRGRYLVNDCEPGFCRVPRELIVEDRRFNNDIKADLILRGIETTKKDGGRSIKFFTGLLPVVQAGVYIGNVLTYGRGGKRIQNGIVIRFSADAGRMTLLYFPAYYPHPAGRTSFVTALINRGLL